MRNCKVKLYVDDNEKAKGVGSDVFIIYNSILYDIYLYFTPDLEKIPPTKSLGVTNQPVGVYQGTA